MTINKPIFDNRTDFDESIQPAPEELEAFLANAGKEGGGEPRINDLAAYRRLLKEVDDFVQRQATDDAVADIRQRILFGVLDHTQFVNPVLLSEVELYAYHLHRLESLDFKNPSAFIKSAEHEIGRLSTKRINDVMRMERLQQMIAERKKILAMLKKQWLQIAPELRRIALYVRENLVRIEKLCEMSVVILAEAGIGRTKEKQLIEDVNNYFKDLLKRALHHGKITKEKLEKARDGVEMITSELSILINEDGNALTKWYETIHDHVKATSQDIAVVLADLESKKGGTVLENLSLFKQLEHLLVSLLLGCRLEINQAGNGPGTRHDSILNAKRTEMLDYLFGQVQKERRARKDRRTQPDRRKANDPNYRGPERRRGGDRRSGKGRRS
ncbi:MAG TPA: hypothetical protein VL122_01475 [Nitrospirota bacterium]|nr:hypothetical protein [Nitrospirota bacterium]